MHETLREKFSPAEAQQCEKDHCRLALDGLRHPVFVLDCDRYCDLHEVRGKTCDFLVFVCSTTPAAAAVEIKSGSNVDATKAVQQIQAGAQHIDSLAGTRAISFYPILLYSEIKHTNELKVLQNRKITFRGRRYRIVYKKCGTHLLEIIEQFH